MEISSSSGKNSSSRSNPWDLLESGQIAWSDFDSKSRGEIVEHYGPKVKFIALRLKAKLPQTIELNELISAGSLGLLEALENFDPSLKIKFSTYAENRIRGAMLDELRKLDWFSRGLRQKVRLMEETIRKLEQEHGSSPSEMEIQENTGLTLAEVQEALEALNNQVCLSLDAIQNNFTPMDRGRGESEPYYSTAQMDIIEKVAECINQLTPKEKLVLSLYYSEELNMKETAEVMEITEGRVSQIHSQAVSKLRKRFQRLYGQSGV